MKQKMFLPHPRVKVSIVGSLRDREVACSASDRQGSNFESCVWRTVSSQSSHHPQEVLLAQFSLYVHKGGLKPDPFHFIFYFTTINWKTYEKPQKYIKICKQTSSDIDKFRIDLNKSNISENIDLNVDADPNTNYEALDGIIENARLRNFPGKTVKLNKYKHKKCNWITQGILKSIKFKNKLYKDMKLSTPQSPEFETLKTNFNNYNKILRHNIRLAKQKYFQTSFINCDQNIKKKTGQS